MSVMYRRKGTDIIYDSESIIKDGKDELIVKTTTDRGENVYELIEKKELELIPDEKSSRIPEDRPNLPLKTELSDFRDSSIDNYHVMSFSSHKFAYNFGIEKVEMNYKVPVENSGYISKEINVNNAQRVELFVDTKSHKGTEYYLIVNNEEIPILANNQFSVEDEKLFFELPTRFKPNTALPISIKVDNLESDLGIDDIHTFDFDNHKYSISYTPEVLVNSYEIKGKPCKVKVVKRYDGINKPEAIHNMVLIGFGGDTSWRT